MNSIRKIKVWGVLLLCLSLFSVTLRADISGTGDALGFRHPGPNCPDNSIDPARRGGELPDPLTVYNQKVELAPGELYLLVGNVVMQADPYSRSRKLVPFLEINFKAQPWLGNATRKIFPYYGIFGDAFDWRSLDGESVRLAARARVTYVMDADGDFHPSYILEVIPEASSVPFVSSIF